MSFKGNGDKRRWEEVQCLFIGWYDFWQNQTEGDLEWVNKERGSIRSNTVSLRNIRRIYQEAAYYCDNLKGSKDWSRSQTLCIIFSYDIQPGYDRAKES